MERNVMVCFGDIGENVVIRANEKLTNEQLTKLAIKSVGHTPSDVYDVKDEELQYYVIDGRCDYTSDSQVEKVLKYIGEA